MEVPAGLKIPSDVIVQAKKQRTKGTRNHHASGERRSPKTKWLPKWGMDKNNKDGSDMSMRLLSPGDEEEIA